LSSKEVAEKVTLPGPETRWPERVWERVIATPGAVRPLCIKTSSIVPAPVELIEIVERSWPAFGAGIPRAVVPAAVPETVKIPLVRAVPPENVRVPKPGVVANPDPEVAPLRETVSVA